jgi:hypothetical protein
MSAGVFQDFSYFCIVVPAAMQKAGFAIILNINVKLLIINYKNTISLQANVVNQ